MVSAEYGLSRVWAELVGSHPCIVTPILYVVACFQIVAHDLQLVKNGLHAVFTSLASNGDDATKAICDMSPADEMQADVAERKRNPKCNNLYDVFVNIRWVGIASD